MSCGRTRSTFLGFPPHDHFLLNPLWQRFYNYLVKIQAITSGPTIPVLRRDRYNELIHQKPQPSAVFFHLSSLPNHLICRHRKVLLLAHKSFSSQRKLPDFTVISSLRRHKPFICSHIQFYTHIYP